MADAALLQRLHRNLMEVSALNGAVPGGKLERGDGTVLYSASPTAQFLNGVFREPGAGDAVALLGRAEDFFADRGRGFVVYVHPDDGALADAAAGHGLGEMMRRYPEMVCHAPLEPIAGDVRPVASPEEASAYWRICDEAYPSIGLPAGMFTETYRPEMLLQDGVEACLGYDRREPVACASVWMAEGVGMIGWVAALPAARGRGLAAAATVWATNTAFALGADAASLQASVMGEPIYKRLGYEEVYAYRMLGRYGPR